MVGSREKEGGEEVGNLVLLVVVNSCRAGTEWSNWESMDCCNVCHADWEDREGEGGTRVGNKQLTHMYTITVSMVSFLAQCAYLCVCLLALWW